MKYYISTKKEKKTNKQTKRIEREENAEYIGILTKQYKIVEVTITTSFCSNIIEDTC